MVHDRPSMFLEQNNAFYNYQFGFRNNHSKNHAVIEITEKMPVKKNPCGVYLDLIKGFNKVNHGILLTKVEHCGIRGASYK